MTRTTAHLRTAIIRGGSMQVLYVSGMPGTGKTATVLEAVRQLRVTKSAPEFAFAHVNAMRLGTPNAFFGELFSQLPRREGDGGPTRCAAGAAHGHLVNYFFERKEADPVVVLLVDETDHLVTRNQAVLYRIFDWLALPSPKLVVVAISNTMDLPERLLPRVASRINVARVDFEPYSRDQITEILKGRLKRHNAEDAFVPTVLKLCAARVAAGSGDIRKAMQLCRRAVEVRLGSPHLDGDLVEIAHLEAAEKELLHANPAAKAICGIAWKARLLLAAVVMEMRRNGVDAVPQQSAVSRYGKLRTACQQGALGLPEGAPHPADEVDFFVKRLESMALLVVQQSVSRHLSGGRFTVGETMLALGAGLDAEDLAGILETAEEDVGVRELLRSSDRCK